MQEIVPPEAPVQKKGFLKNIFSKTAPNKDLEKLPELPTLPQLPPLGTSPKKKTRKKIEKVDVSNRFDWARPISDQDPIIKDSIRNNPDINLLLESTQAQIKDQSTMTGNTLLTQP